MFNSRLITMPIETIAAVFFHERSRDGPARARLSKPGHPVLYRSSSQQNWRAGLACVAGRPRARDSHASATMVVAGQRGG